MRINAQNEAPNRRCFLTGREPPVEINVLNCPLTDDARGVDGESAGNRMTSIAAGGVDRLLRSTAYDVLCRRDRLLGWKAHRRALLTDSRRPPEELARTAE